MSIVGQNSGDQVRVHDGRFGCCERGMSHATLLGPRQMSRLRIIEALYRHPLSSRADLARHTQLSRATGRRWSRSSCEQVWSKSAPAPRRCSTGAEGGVGRPPVLLSLVSGAAFALGLDFGHQHIRVALCDLSGEPIIDDFSAAEVDDAPSESLDLAQRLVHEALDSAGVAPDQLLGVGMGLAAPINKATGNLEANGILPGWDGIRPAAEMETRLGVPVALDNDANLGALGEKAFGAARGVDDLVYIRVSAGIGAGLIIDGQPYQGSPSAWRARSVMCSLIHRARSAAAAIAAAWNGRQPRRGCRPARAQPPTTHHRSAPLLELVAEGRPRGTARGRGCRRGSRSGVVDGRQRAQPRARGRRWRPRAGRRHPPFPDRGRDRAP